MRYRDRQPGAVSPRRFFLLLVSLLALWGASAVPAGAVQVGVVTEITWGISRSEIDQSIAVLKESGDRWIRANVSWSAIEPAGKGVYNTTYLANVDYAIEQARAAGLEVEMPIADGVPYWASADPNKYQDSTGYHYNRLYRPTSFQEYAEFAGWVANRYKDKGVNVFEVWNEPNHSWFWPSGPNAVTYTEMLKAAYPAIKQADPSATVLMGGLSKNDYYFLQAMYEAGAGPYFDAVNVHPYTGAVDPTQCWLQSGTTMNAIDAFCGVEQIYKTMLANGDGAKKIWLTEFGYSSYTGSYGVTEAQQAEYLTKAFKKAESLPYVQAAFWYRLRDWYTEGDDWGSHLGLVSSTFSAKPVFAAFKALATGSSSPSGSASTGSSAGGPTVTLSAPVSGSSFSTSLAFAANASDAKGISKVQFWIDGHLIHTSTSAPYSYTWSVSKKISYGTHTVKAVAYDPAGLSASATASVTRVMSGVTLSVTSASASTARHVRHLRARRSARVERISGAVAGRNRGSVILRLAHLVHKRWVKVLTVSAGLNYQGHFGRTIRCGGGRWRIRAVYVQQRLLASGYRYFAVA